MLTLARTWRSRDMLCVVCVSAEWSGVGTLYKAPLDWTPESWTHVFIETRGQVAPFWKTRQRHATRWWAIQNSILTQ